ncbi:MAG: phosphatidylglycerol lysyltransferase domain-containing protein [Rhodobacteraceae bacterium]|nr:phosphatidylglycerol lysyltransferase domain-containing protein [Paracoccaceae bacterium]
MAGGARPGPEASGTDPEEAALAGIPGPLDELRDALRPFVPPVLAALVFLSGAVLLLSSALPEEGGRLALLRRLLPLPFAEASHLFASLAGLALIVLARGLALRMAQARIAAQVFLIAGAGFALAKGLAWEDAILLVAAAFGLWLARGAFYRRGDWRRFRPGALWLGALALVVAAVGVVALIAHSNVDYRNELWWRFAWSGDAPRALRALLAAAVALGVLALDLIVNRAPPTRARRRPVPDAVRRLVADCPVSARHLALLGDKEFILSEAGDAFLMYGVQGRSWICLGGPVGAPDACDALVWDFLDRADRAAARPVFLSVQPDGIMRLLDIGHAIVKLGELARIDLAAFDLAGPGRKDLRYARSRAVRDGLAFSVLPRADVPAAAGELKAVSDAWLATRRGREKGFALGFFDPEYLAEFDLAVMRKEGRIVAFANLMRGAGVEMSIDLMRHLPGQSPVLMEAMMTETILLARAEGYQWFSLGGAPLSGLPAHRMAPLSARIGRMIYQRGDDFYSFGGLRAFKQKFDPVWTSLYLTCPTGRSIPAAMVDCALIVSRGRAGQDDAD